MERDGKEMRGGKRERERGTPESLPLFFPSAGSIKGKRTEKEKTKKTGERKWFFVKKMREWKRRYEYNNIITSETEKMDNF